MGAPVGVLPCRASACAFTAIDCRPTRPEGGESGWSRRAAKGKSLLVLRRDCVAQCLLGEVVEVARFALDRWAIDDLRHNDHGRCGLGGWKQRIADECDDENDRQYVKCQTPKGTH